MLYSRDIPFCKSQACYIVEIYRSDLEPGYSWLSCLATLCLSGVVVQHYVNPLGTTYNEKYVLKQWLIMEPLSATDSPCKNQSKNSFWRLLERKKQGQNHSKYSDWS